MQLLRFRRLGPGGVTAALLAISGCSGGDHSAAQPGSVPAAAPAGAAAQVASNGDPRARIFLAKGCPQCHSISAFGIKSPTDVGPDLTHAAQDVKTRFGTELKEFLHNPTGTMMVVLSAQIQLSPPERDSIIEILEDIHEGSAGKQ